MSSCVALARRELGARPQEGIVEAARRVAAEAAFLREEHRRLCVLVRRLGGDPYPVPVAEQVEAEAAS